MRRIRVTVAVTMLAAGLVFTSPALAAFPGADGLLAVQPASGGGILLVAANGRGVHRICTDRQRCGTPTRPRWSPDGRAMVFAGPRIRIVYTDGSCMNCQFGAAPGPAFKPSGTAISFIQRGRVIVDGIDTVRKASPRVGAATDAVWAADGRIAVIRGGTIWAGRLGRLHRLAVGAQPSWSPRGVRIAAAQDGWVVIVRLSDDRVQRVARGSAPAFSPDGRWVAFVAPDHRLMIIAARTHARPRAVGRIRAVSVDWQPRPRGANPGCAAPPDSTVVASAPDATVTQDGALPPYGFTFAPAIAYMGCLRADGRERLLTRFVGNTVDGASWVKSAVLAAPYAALVAHSEDEHYGGQSDSVQVFDLRTGLQRKDLGGESASCPAVDGCEQVQQVTLSRDGVSAAHIYALAPIGWLTRSLVQDSCAPGGTLCVAIDQSGGLFTSSDPSAGATDWSAGVVSTRSGAAPDVVACPSQTLCVAAGVDIYTSSSPGGGASTWTVSAPPGTPSASYGMSCPSVSLCVVSRLDGTVATSTDPTGGAQAWRVTSIDPGVALGAVLCSTEPRCFVTAAPGNVFTSTNPGGGANAWAPSGTTPPFKSGACPTQTLCVTVNGQEIAATTDLDAGSWTRQSTSEDLLSVTCPSASLCVAVGDGGALDVTTDPASGNWTHTTVDDGRSLTWVSCASTALCVATDASGHVLTATNPTAGPSAWTRTLLDGDPCVESTPCGTERIVASDATGVRTVDSIKYPGYGIFQTGLTLNGDVLSWYDYGSLHTVTLTPP